MIRPSEVNRYVMRLAVEPSENRNSNKPSPNALDSGIRAVGPSKAVDDHHCSVPIGIDKGDHPLDHFIVELNLGHLFIIAPTLLLHNSDH